MPSQTAPSCCPWSAVTMLTSWPRRASARASSVCCTDSPPTVCSQYSGARTGRLSSPTRQIFILTRAAPLGSAAYEPQPPLTVQSAEPGRAALHRGDDVGMARMDERPGAFTAQPAVPVGQLLHAMRIQATSQRRGALPPGVEQQSSQHMVKALLAGGELQDLVDHARARVIDEPAEEPLAIEDRASAQLTVANLARGLLQQPCEGAPVVQRAQRTIAVYDLGHVGEHRTGVQRLVPHGVLRSIEAVRVQPCSQCVRHRTRGARRA